MAYIINTSYVHLIAEEVNNMGIRVRLYGTERMRRERMIGEAVVGFASVNQDTETTHWLTLEPRSNLSVSKFICLITKYKSCGGRVVKASASQLGGRRFETPPGLN